jgi:hypothetical protein
MRKLSYEQVLIQRSPVKPALNGPFIKRKFVLNKNIFRSRDFGAQKDVKYPRLTETV